MKLSVISDLISDLKKPRLGHMRKVYSGTGLSVVDRPGQY